MVAHASGVLYVYDRDLRDTQRIASHHHRSTAFSVTHQKHRKANPLAAWSVGKGSVEDFGFSPNCKHLAIVTRDGCLRVFDFEREQLLSVARSFFGAFLCGKLACFCFSVPV